MQLPIHFRGCFSTVKYLTLRMMMVILEAIVSSCCTVTSHLIFGHVTPYPRSRHTLSAIMSHLIRDHVTPHPRSSCPRSLLHKNRL
eukprot:809270-Rhodomonas_salina.2